MLAPERRTGLSVHIGGLSSWIVPVYEGFVMPLASRCLEIGSLDIINYLMTILSDRGYGFSTTAEREIVRDIKENCASLLLTLKM
mmetsp:Transcript_21772/g.27743  ORF Transcript_21772/g.27743 Transcript_21772/m.27743 type:complete len:85 (-) Transcript_21772:755-1009(-)